jgi:methylmalonyl-CoA/ethylmalonyl-CoA epimerase
MVRLNHIGIAISQLPQLTRLFSILGLSLDHSQEVPDQGVRTHFFPLSTQSASLELLEVTDPTGTVAQFLKRRGPGIHHLALSVGLGSLASICETLKSEGYRLVYSEPRQGAHGAKINFIHPSTSEGILIELMEEVSS